MDPVVTLNQILASARAGIPDSDRHADLCLALDRWVKAGGFSPVVEIDLSTFGGCSGCPDYGLVDSVGPDVISVRLYDIDWTEDDSIEQMHRTGQYLNVWLNMGPRYITNVSLSRGPDGKVHTA